MPFGNIFIIKSKVSDKCYVGVTIQDIKVRFNQIKLEHKNWCETQKDWLSVYELIENDGFKNLYIELLEKIWYDDKLDLFRIGGYFESRIENRVNKYVHSGLTTKEYSAMKYQQNKEMLKSKVACPKCQKEICKSYQPTHIKICSK